MTLIGIFRHYGEDRSADLITAQKEEMRYASFGIKGREMQRHLSNYPHKDSIKHALNCSIM